MTEHTRPSLWCAACIVAGDLLCAGGLQAEPPPSSKRDSQEQLPQPAEAQDEAQRSKPKRADEAEPAKRESDHKARRHARTKAKAEKTKPRPSKGAKSGPEPRKPSPPVELDGRSPEPEADALVKPLRPVPVRLAPAEKEPPRGPEKPPLEPLGRQAKPTDPNPGDNAEQASDSELESPAERTLRMEIQAALQRQKTLSLAAKLVTVEVRGTAATLSGQVLTDGERRAVERAARDTPGVHRVENRLRVRNAVDGSRERRRARDD